jgi:glucose/arabinose dehydrogenase
VVFDDWPLEVGLHQGADGEPVLAAGFRDEIVLTGLNRPTAFLIAPDGRVLVTEQRGTVIAFPGLEADSGEVFLDLRTEVFGHGQLGLLGLALDPEYPAEPYLYLAYSRDAPIGGEAPTYGVVGEDREGCPDPDNESCITSGRISRFSIPATEPPGREQVLVEDWCQTWRTHSIGTIAFDSDGALIAGGGDGAQGGPIDFGQLSIPPDACRRPPLPPGATVAPPDAVGGSLRSQGLWATPDDISLNGTIIRVDRATGAGLPDNPLAEHGDVNARRALAIGLRNPFRFVFRPGTDELWIADVGWDQYEEINVLDTRSRDVANFGWPCFEGPARQPQHAAAGHAICRQLYAADPTDVVFPAFSFAHGSPESAGTGPCSTGASAITALTFYDGGQYPARYDGALFFADQPRGCMWVIHAGADGLPDGDDIELFATGIAAVDLQVGPDGALYYVDPVAGSLRRIVNDR